ncbi:nucleoside deaminase [Christiangramia fulva]|uniref:Nucleoside deaminase n=1 Tax=Christiangramia fulva TaxID=2126553 RepID=A0A2R3ZB10_9FLAO|nr:nucleoside deaminase [Christiangramia fulva]AVR47483.1 nucleoside deaminase [Christiangramia fulva]
MIPKDFPRRMMSRAIHLAREGRDMDNGKPFGAVVTKGEEIIAEARSEVICTGDFTQHAILRTIRKASRKLKSRKLSGCVLYTSCEPCMMCLGAAYWADFDYIYFGASAQDAVTRGFSYSGMYRNSDPHQRHDEFKMIQLCREEAIQVLKAARKENLKT